MISFNLKYDPDTDIFNIAFGRAKKSVSVEKEPEVFIRLDPKTHEVLGLTVLGFKQNFLSQKQDISIAPPISA